MNHVNARVQKHRDQLRQAGLRPVQLWVPDTRKTGFAAACSHQCHLVAQADAADADLHHWMDAALDDIDGWAI